MHALRAPDACTDAGMSYRRGDAGVPRPPGCRRRFSRPRRGTRDTCGGLRLVCGLLRSDLSLRPQQAARQVFARVPRRRNHAARGRMQIHLSIDPSMRRYLVTYLGQHQRGASRRSTRPPGEHRGAAPQRWDLAVTHAFCFPPWGHGGTARQRSPYYGATTTIPHTA